MTEGSQPNPDHDQFDDFLVATFEAERRDIETEVEMEDAIAAMSAAVLARGWTPLNVENERSIEAFEELVEQGIDALRESLGLEEGNPLYEMPLETLAAIMLELKAETEQDAQARVAIAYLQKMRSEQGSTETGEFEDLATIKRTVLADLLVRHELEPDDPIVVALSDIIPDPPVSIDDIEFIPFLNKAHREQEREVIEMQVRISKLEEAYEAVGLHQLDQSVEAATARETINVIFLRSLQFAEPTDGPNREEAIRVIARQNGFNPSVVDDLVRYMDKSFPLG